MREEQGGLTSVGRETLRAVFDALPQAAAVVGPDQTVRAWNAAAEQRTGWAAADVVGEVDPMVPDEDRDRTADTLADWLRHPEHGRRMILPRTRPDGERMELVLHDVAPVQLPDGDGLVVFFDEASEVDALLLQRNRLSHELVAVTRQEDVLSILTEAMQQVLHAHCAVALRRCPGGEQHLHGLVGIGLDTEVAEQVQLPLGGTEAWDAALAGQLADGRLELDGQDHDVTFVPMGPEGQGWLLATCGTHAGSAPRPIQDLFTGLADEAWAALQRVELVSELDGKIEILQATNRLAASVGLDLDEALADVTEQAAEALSCERAAVYLTDPASRQVVLAEVYASDASAEQLVAEDEGLAVAEEVVATGTRVLHQDVSTCPEAAGPWHADAGAVAIMGLPLLLGTRSVGALVVAHTIANPRGFTSLCQQVGAAVAQQAAVAFEHARLFQAERDNVARLEELDRMKADWMAGVTHDLKAPLTGLLGFVETLRRMGDEATAEEQHRYLNVMSRQADQLVNLVEDLLLSARVDAAEVARRRDLVAPDELVRGAVAALDPQERQAVTVHDDGITTPVLGDASHLKRVLANLLTNALRHRTSEVAVHLGHDRGQVLIVVEDDGQGVPVEDRERIFDRFVHGDHEGSSGLGLYVARGIVRAHDGAIHVTDRRDGASGARFEVRFPRGRRQREQDLDARVDDELEVTEERRRSQPPIG